MQHHQLRTQEGTCKDSFLPTWVMVREINNPKLGPPSKKAEGFSQVSLALGFQWGNSEPPINLLSQRDKWANFQCPFGKGISLATVNAVQLLGRWFPRLESYHRLRLGNTSIWNRDERISCLGIVTWLCWKTFRPDLKDGVAAFPT